MSTVTVYVQNWEESERGWGTRPDGYTIHPNLAHRNEYVNWYYQTHNNSTLAPDTYARVDGAPTPVEVDRAFYTKLVSRTKSQDVAVWGSGAYFDPRTCKLKLEDLD